MAFMWWFRIHGTVIPAIWWQVLMLLVYTAAVTCTETFVPFLYKGFPSTLMNIIGTVIGLLVTFRTDTAYNRYWEGRQLWSGMTQEVRKLTRAIWAGVKEKESKDVIEKVSALNLCIAFVVATKHYVRDEYSYTYEDLTGLLEHLTKYGTPSSNIPLLQQQQKRRKRAYAPQAYDKATPTNIPIEVSYYLVSYAKHLEESQLADAWALSTIHSSISNLVDSIAGFERILRTPMPLAYSIHLQVCVWLYLLSLPYQIIADVGPWWAIPITGLAGVCYIGILAIGFEIENPFGFDANDLPLEDFCDVIRYEIQAQLAGEVPVANDWIFSPVNRPFAPMCTLSARQLAEQSLEEVHNTLRNCARSHLISDVEDAGAQNVDILNLTRRTSKGYQTF